MKKILFKTTGSIAPVLLRLFIALVLFPHGAQKLLGWFGGFGFDGTMNYFTRTVGLPWFVGLAVIIIEFFGPLFLVLGFATRFWSLAIVGIMTGIILTNFSGYFFMNWFGNQKTEGMEFFLLAIGMSLSLLISGAGRFSIDGLLSKPGFQNSKASNKFTDLNIETQMNMKTTLFSETISKSIILFFLSLLFIPAAMSQQQPKEVVKQFLKNVRSGANPGKAKEYMADTILAHQVNSENPVTVKRSPENYEAHVRSFLELFGKFEFEITELIADGDKVYARWIQKGKHMAKLDDYEPTGLPLIEYTSAVYRVINGRITEYWLQSDRLGFEEQLKHNKSVAQTTGK